MEKILLKVDGEPKLYIEIDENTIVSQVKFLLEKYMDDNNLDIADYNFSSSLKNNIFFNKNYDDIKIYDIFMPGGEIRISKKHDGLKIYKRGRMMYISEFPISTDDIIVKNDVVKPKRKNKVYYVIKGRNGEILTELFTNRQELRKLYNSHYKNDNTFMTDVYEKWVVENKNIK